MEAPVVSVIVVCHNEEKRISACLDSLIGQNFSEPWELIVVNNRSTDTTAEIVRERMAGCPFMRLLDNDSKTISSGRNLGWHGARADLVAYTDADCIAPPHWLAMLVAAFRAQKRLDPQLAGVGGGNYQPDDTRFYRALRAFLASPFGNRGSTQTERFESGRYVESLAALNVLYEKAALESVGGYDDELFPFVGEDEDLNTRLIAAGRGVFYVPDCNVLHFWRDSLRGWFRNMYVYGIGRARLRRRHPARKRLTDLLCLALPAAILLASVSWFAWWLCLPLMGAVAFLMIVSSTAAFGAREPSLLPLVFLLFFGTFLFYGLGFVKGAVSGRGNVSAGPR